jgi:hypothetical protein
MSTGSTLTKGEQRIDVSFIGSRTAVLRMWKNGKRGRVIKCSLTAWWKRRDQWIKEGYIQTYD